MRILVVEDEILIALDTQEILLMAGHAVIGPAGSLDEAEALCEAGPPDAAILDVNLRGQTVWPLARKLSKMGVPYVLVTGLGGSQEIPPDIDPAACLSKPVTKSMLQSAVSVLQGHATLKCG